MKISSLPVLACLSMLVAVPAFASPIDASLVTKANATVYDHTAQGGAPVANSDTDSASWSGVPASLSVSASATASDPAYGTASTFSNALASWAADGNSGSVILDYGWTSGMEGTSFAMDTVMNPTWSYHFTADADGLFTMNYAFSGTGDLFGLIGIQMKLSGETEGGIDPYVPLTGTYSRAVLAGQEYTVVIRNQANIAGGSGVYDGAAHVEFNWSLPGGTAPGVPDAGPSAAWYVLGTTLLFVKLKGRRKAAEVRAYNQPTPAAVPDSPRTRKPLVGSI